MKVHVEALLLEIANATFRLSRVIRLSKFSTVEIVATRDLHMDADYAVIGGDNYHSGRDLDLKTCLIYTVISTLYLY